MTDFIFLSDLYTVVIQRLCYLGGGEAEQSKTDPEVQEHNPPCHSEILLGKYLNNTSSPVM